MIKTTTALTTALKWAARTELPEGHRLDVEVAPEVELDGSAEALQRQDAEAHTKTGIAARQTSFPVRITLTRLDGDVWTPVGDTCAVVAARDADRPLEEGTVLPGGVAVCSTPLGADPRDGGLVYGRVHKPKHETDVLDAWLTSVVSAR